MGVYRITSSRSDKIYVGFGIDLPAKINRHKAELKFGSHRNRELQEAWDLFGETSFEFEVLDVLDHKEAPHTDPAEELQALLEMWINRLEDEHHIIETL